jgi:hypothetical protein
MTIFLNGVFTKENTTSSLRKSSSPFFLQEFRPLTPLKETWRFTSLTVIRVTKIMCNIHGTCTREGPQRAPTNTGSIHGELEKVKFPISRVPWTVQPSRHGWRKKRGSLHFAVMTSNTKVHMAVFS